MHRYTTKKYKNIYACKYFQNICCMWVYVYIHNKYTQYTHIGLYYVNKNFYLIIWQHYFKNVFTRRQTFQINGSPRGQNTQGNALWKNIVAITDIHIRTQFGSLSLPKNSRSFALELLQRLREKNTDMADSDGIKTQISLTTPWKTSPVQIGLSW